MLSPIVLQYVSALRPPKKRHHIATGVSIDSDTDEDAYLANKIGQRRSSLIYPKPLGTRDCFHNRSLQDFTDRIKVSTEDELEIQRRKQSLLNSAISKPDKDSLSASSESVNSDNAKEEWKQVKEDNGYLNYKTSSISSPK